MNCVPQTSCKWVSSFLSAQGQIDRRDSSAPFNPNVLRASSDLENGGIRRAKKSVVSVEEAGLEQGWGMV